MAANGPTLIRAFLPVAVILLVAAAAGLGIHLLRGDRSDPVEDTDSNGRKAEPPPPDPVPAPGEAFREAKRKVRASLGEDVDAIHALQAAIVAEPALIPERLSRSRTELSLAVHSDSFAAKQAVLALLGEVASKGGDRGAEIVRSTGYRSLYTPLLRDGSALLRVHAVRFLAGLGGPLARSEIVRMLEDTDPGVRTEAVRSYGAGTEAPSAARLASMHRTDPSATVRLEILRVLAGPHRPGLRREAVAAEVRSFETGTVAEKLEALGNLERYRDHPEIAPALALLSDESRAVREGLLRTLLVLRDRRARKPLQDYLEEEEDADLRARVERILAALG